jgi:hypothetical protein
LFKAVGGVVTPSLTKRAGPCNARSAAWAFAHGKTNLELNGRFPSDADLGAAWKRGIAALRAFPASRQ